MFGNLPKQLIGTESAKAVASDSKLCVPSRQSQRGLDLFAFFLADIQTGWGPFVAVYLTSKGWTQFDIGLILTVGTLSAIALQIPIGALIDRVPAKRTLAAIAVVAITGSALLLAWWPIFWVVLLAKILHAIASCIPTRHVGADTSTLPRE